MSDWKQVYIRESTHQRLNDVSDTTGTKIQYLADRLVSEGLDNMKEKKHETSKDQRTSSK